MTERFGSPRGYTLVEMLISMGIMITVTGAIFQMVNPSQGTARVQPEYGDMQQRARVAAETLYKDLVMAGAGPYQGATTGSLANFFAPILPYRTGRVNPDPPGTYRDDAITIVYVPHTSAQTTISSDMPNQSSEIKVNSQSNCPVGDPLCGFTEGMGCLIFDPLTGAFDNFEITSVQESALHLQHRGQDFSESYPLGAVIVQSESHTYYHDPIQNQLRHYDGIQTDIPVVDNVVDVVFDYWGDPDPPTAPRPPLNVANCVIDEAGNPRLAQLAPGTGSLVRLDPAILRDGLPAWCGAGTNQFDPDLFRVRKVQMRLRVQASDPGMRPNAAALASSPELRRLFMNPGTGMTGSEGFVPDFEVILDVTPRNLNLTR
ncbi:MAG TPA: hypothetical protein VK886_00815 [Vicinamibacterales bacterium]|nr:hypothetical protein [Vicinamibacterales bacterium]